MDANFISSDRPYRYIIVPRTSGFSRLYVDFLYSLYDALVSINVPSDKARAVVDAMERDMGTTLATKQDLEILRRDMENRFALVGQRFDSLASALEQRFGAVESSFEQRISAVESNLEQRIGAVESRLDQKIETVESRLELKIDALELRMTVKLGSMMILGFGLVIAALRAWG
jgi:hypothetical protein